MAHKEIDKGSKDKAKRWSYTVILVMIVHILKDSLVQVLRTSYNIHTIFIYQIYPAKQPLHHFVVRPYVLTTILAR